MDSEEESKRDEFNEEDDGFGIEEGFQEESKLNLQKEPQSPEEVFLGYIENDKMIQPNNTSKEEMVGLSFETRGNVYVTIFLAGVSKNRHNVFKTTIMNNKSEFEDFIIIKDDEKFFDLITKEHNIIMKAIEYTIETKMISILEHIIQESTVYYLDMHIKADVIKKLICMSDDSANKLILRRL